jgi:ribosomal protein S27E
MEVSAMSSAHQAAAIASAKKLLERTCPQCHHVQEVAGSKKKEEVPCHSCGAAIPPKQKES